MKTYPSAVPMLVALLGTAAIAPLVVVFMYRHQFSGQLSSDPAAWGQFGDYLGGTLNPVLAFLSFTALVITLAIQTRQLDISSKQLEASEKELAATRLELTRTADAQVSTSKALAKQAEFSALSAKLHAVSEAIRVVDSELERFSSAIDPTSTVYAYRQQYIDQKTALASELNSTVTAIRAA